MPRMSKKNRLLNSPKTLTARQRKNIRYKIKLDMRRYADFFVAVMESDDEQLKSYAMGQIARLAKMDGSQPGSDTERPEDSAENSLWR